MKQCKYCGGTWVPEGQDKCYTCFALLPLLQKDLARTREVFDQSQLVAALKGNRTRYFAIMKDLEKTNE